MSETKSRRKAVTIAVIAAVIIVLLIAVFLFYTKSLVPSQAYNSALSLMEAGNFEDAIEAFELMGGYKDSKSKAEECRTAILEAEYNAALSLMNEGKYAEAISAFAAVDYQDSAAKVEECKEAYLKEKYDRALELMNEGKYREASIIFKPLNYKDSAEKYEECLTTSPGSFIRIGDTITFGSYEQDSNIANGREPLTWRVLDKQDGKLLIITEKAINKRPYFAIYWKRSYISAYMETELMPGLTEEEKAMLLKSLVPADINPYSPDTDQGADTEDYFFLLSVPEAEELFKNNEDRECYATAYAKRCGLNTDTKGRCDWWLRTASENWDSGATITFVEENGLISVSNHRSRLGLRPACWIKIEG